MFSCDENYDFYDYDTKCHNFVFHKFDIKIYYITTTNLWYLIIYKNLNISW